MKKFIQKNVTLIFVTCSLDSVEYSRDFETELFNFENCIKFNIILKWGTYHKIIIIIIIFGKKKCHSSSHYMFLKFRRVFSRRWNRIIRFWKLDRKLTIKKNNNNIWKEIKNVTLIYITCSLDSAEYSRDVET